jgi:sugar phosphate isomerase/epimerase
MIVGCGEWGFRALPMEEHFRIAKKFGFRFLEFGIGGGQLGRLPEEPQDADVETFLGLGREYAIKTPFCCIENDFTLPDAAEHTATLTRVLMQMRWARKFGATHVRLFAGFMPATAMTEALWVQVVGAFQACEKLAAELGLEIGIETHGAIAFDEAGAALHTGTITTDRASLARLLRELPPRVGFNYDPGNIKAARPSPTHDPELCLDLLNDRINYCHLKDWKRHGKGWIAGAIGDDDLDYSPIFARMRFDGVYLIEYEPLEDTEDGIRRSLDYLGRVAAGFSFA